uniref:Protein phosphatase 1 regulatory subunit 12Blike [Aplysia californica] n=2 Tax=Lepeophtheirus salmonis TaxID=72036 RepID=A0A0K2TK13_LEPSM
MQDADYWTPLHAACANGLHEIAKYLVDRGARTSILTDRKERPLDLVDPGDSKTLAVMLAHLERKR